MDDDDIVKDPVLLHVVTMVKILVKMVDML